MMVMIGNSPGTVMLQFIIDGASKVHYLTPLGAERLAAELRLRAQLARLGEESEGMAKC